MISPSFSGQVAVVTGAGSGIGRAIALDLAARGAIVYLVSRTATALVRTQRCIEELGGRAMAICGDVTVDTDMAAVVATVRETYGRLDVLIHGAGVYARGIVEHAPVEDLDTQYRTNVRGPYVLTQLLLPLLKPTHGQIVFINSSAGSTASAGLSGYAASKHALKALADALRDEVNPLGIRVISLYPGRTNTPMQRQIHGLEGREYNADRLMQPEDVADIVGMILSLPRSTEVTNVTARPAKPPQ
jgi:NAD(P)-dependent dehydrogenase (short-subunit alcohol dehydrogenase family)